MRCAYTRSGLAKLRLRNAACEELQQTQQVFVVDDIVCDNVCVMEKGLFVDAGTSEEVFSNPKSDYTKHLLEVVPKIPIF